MIRHGKRKGYSGRVRNMVGHHAAGARYGGDIFTDPRNTGQESNMSFEYFTNSQSGPVKAPRTGSK